MASACAVETAAAFAYAWTARCRPTAPCAICALHSARSFSRLAVSCFCLKSFAMVRNFLSQLCAIAYDFAPRDGLLMVRKIGKNLLLAHADLGLLVNRLLFGSRSIQRIDFVYTGTDDHKRRQNNFNIGSDHGSRPQDAKIQSRHNG